MKRYLYTPLVEAGKIEAIQWDMGDRCRSVVVDGLSIETPHDLLARAPRRGVGDYLLCWPTGCLTVVPAKVFEAHFQLAPEGQLNIDMDVEHKGEG